jgi:hypothetical protein
MLRPGPGADQKALERFQLEARAMAQLDHPNVVPIYGEGAHQGEPYFTMKLFEGGSLAEHRERLRNDVRKAVGLLGKVARAVHYLHEKGVLHRDLKPSNILLDGQDEPHVGDFGLAKFLDAELELTQTGEVLGTFAYMAPEQAAGRKGEVGPPADVWALGVMLYELLCGRRPFATETREELLHEIRNGEAPSPGSVRPGLDRYLEAVILRCLAKEPAQRFASAAEVADELQRWLETGKPRTRPASSPARAWRAARRRPLLTAAVVFAVLVPFAMVLLGRLLDPERPLRTMQQERAAGRTVRPIDADGRLRWSRWRAGIPVRIYPLGGSDGLRFVGPALTLLEVYTDESPAPYEFRAWVRHDGGEDGEVGVFFGLREYAGPNGPVLGYCTCAFNDIRATELPLGRKDNPIVVNFNLYRQEDPDRSVPALHPLTIRLGKAQRFLPACLPLRAGPWRQLVVRVTPEDIQTTWKGDTIETAALSRDVFLRRAAALHAGCKEVTGAAPEFPPRAAVGLFVRDAEVSFKAVEIAPLPTNHN